MPKFPQFKKDFDAIFDDVTPNELVKDLESMGAKFDVDFQNSIDTDDCGMCSGTTCYTLEDIYQAFKDRLQSEAVPLNPPIDPESITIELSIENALQLKALMQNSLNGSDDPSTEELSDYTLRTAVWCALGDVNGKWNKY